MSNDLKINSRFGKLKRAKLIALTKGSRKKVLSNAEELINDVNTQIKSLALRKFAVRKVKKLKTLGETKDNISEIITDLMSSEDSFLSKKLFNINASISGFGLDKKYIGLTSEEILDKVNYNSSEKDNSRNSSSGTQKKVKKDKGGKDSLKIKVNSDVDTLEDVEENNEKIYDYLIKNGEVDIANYILELMTEPSKKEPKKISEIENNTKEIKRLSSINSSIFEKLDDLENSIDKQDTSISIPQKLQKKVDFENVESIKEDKSESGFLSSLLGMMFGSSIMKWLIGAGGSLLVLSTTLLSAGFGWLKKKFTSLFTGMFKMAIAPFKLILDKIKGVLKGILPPKLPAKLLPTSIKKSEKITKMKEVTKTSGVKDKIKGETKSLKGNNVKKVSKIKIKTPGILKKLLKFTKPIPFLGTALMAGSAIYSAQDGYNNASEILGKENSKLTEVDKLASAAGALVNDISFGVVSAKSTAENILGWVNSKEESGNNNSNGKSQKRGSKNSRGKNRGSSVPEKSSISNLTSFTDNNFEQIKTLTSNVDFLMQEYSKANGVKKENIKKNIDVFNTKIEKIESNKFQKVPSAVVISKEKKMIQAERAYSSAIGNTKAYDSNNSKQLGVNNKVELINNISQTKSNNKVSSFDLFENL